MAEFVKFLPVLAYDGSGMKQIGVFNAKPELCALARALAVLHLYGNTVLTDGRVGDNHLVQRIGRLG